MSLTHAARVTAATVLLSTGAALIGVSAATAHRLEFSCDAFTSTKDPEVDKLMRQLGESVPTSGTVGMVCRGPSGEFIGQELVLISHKTGAVAFTCTDGNNGFEGLVASFTGCKAAGSEQRRSKRPLLRLR